MGENAWRDEQEWPLARAKPTRFYLHSGGTANTRMGNGTLTDKAPGTELSDKYAYDPRYPVPTYGGHGSGGGGITRDGAFSIQGPMDQRSTQQRNDVLVYTTDALTADTEVTGAPELSLFFSTSVTDTDFFATLSDVYPDGRAILITEGALRTRYRESREKTKLLTPNQTYEVKIPLWETSNVFKSGPPDPAAPHQQQFPALQPQPEFRQADGRGDGERHQGRQPGDPARHAASVVAAAAGDSGGGRQDQIARN